MTRISADTRKLIDDLKAPRPSDQVQADAQVDRLPPLFLGRVLTPTAPDELHPETRYGGRAFQVEVLRQYEHAAAPRETYQYTVTGVDEPEADATTQSIVVEMPAAVRRSVAPQQVVSLIGTDFTHRSESRSSDGDYRVTAIAEVDGDPESTRLTLDRLLDDQQHNHAGGVLALDGPRELTGQQWVLVPIESYVSSTSVTVLIGSEWRLSLTAGDRCRITGSSNVGTYEIAEAADRDVTDEDEEIVTGRTEIVLTTPLPDHTIETLGHIWLSVRPHWTLERLVPGQVLTASNHTGLLSAFGGVHVFAMIDGEPVPISSTGMVEGYLAEPLNRADVNTTTGVIEPAEARLIVYAEVPTWDASGTPLRGWYPVGQILLRSYSHTLRGGCNFYTRAEYIGGRWSPSYVDELATPSTDIDASAELDLYDEQTALTC